MATKDTHRQDSGRLAKGFTHAADLVKNRFRSEAERRGFAATQLLTSWREVVGEEFASMSEPIEIAFDARKGEVTLTVLSSGAYAEQVRMSTPILLERVNAAYGYKAVERIRVTQSWKGRRAKTQAERKRQTGPPRLKSGESEWTLPESLGEIQDKELKEALTQLGSLICANPDTEKGTRND